ncbi:MAG: hypothetical protein WCS37_05280 [Chloroflexota bacterium]|nr:hypothetical protein [Chloroflexota bacterium]
MPEQNQIKRALICYTQTIFDKLTPTPEPKEETEEDALALQIVRVADNLTTALKIAGVTAEQVKVPQRSSAPRDVAKAAFGWRLLDLSESNGVKIEMVICLDFPAWSLNHPNKVCWLLSRPNFVGRKQPNGSPPPNSSPSLNGHTPSSIAQTVASLLQAERRGLAEAKRVVAGDREIAQELARSGLQTEFNPFPVDLSIDPAGPEWQIAVKRLVSAHGNK